MISAQQSLDFIYDRISVLAESEHEQQCAMAMALNHLATRWTEPPENDVNEDIAVAEKIGQDLAELQRHIMDVQNAYMQRVFEDL